MPLLLKDLAFLDEGNKTNFAGACRLVNFEKMHMIGNVIRESRCCKRKWMNYHHYSQQQIEMLPTIRCYASKIFIRDLLYHKKYLDKQSSDKEKFTISAFFRNLRVIDNRRLQLELSYCIEPPWPSTHSNPLSSATTNNSSHCIFGQRRYKHY